MPKNSYAFEWQDLWRTKDQQAQQAFQKGQFGQAAALFENPDWRAAAHYKAGEYEQALQNLNYSPKTADSFYNQGNALAQTGKLEEALKAYEQALKMNPDDADAKFNKELVEKELEKQKQQQQQQQQQGGDQQRSKDDAQQSQDDQAQQSGDQDKSDTDSGQQTPEKQQPEQNQQHSDQQNDAAETGQEAQQEQGKEQPAQPATESSTEQHDESEQANEQWLKRIPDDPAGLLKRKFKYQYGQRERPARRNAQTW